MNSKIFGIIVIFCMCIYIIQTEKVSVSVYYESLCPDSRKFFTSQLYPTLAQSVNLSERINLTLIPFGKSNYTNRDGDYQFTCHHGPFECYGNKIQACALNNIKKDGDAGFNPITVAFINCLMDKVQKIEKQNQPPEYSFPILNCSEINGVPNYVVNIENCAGHPDAGNYLAKFGNLTAELQPPLKSVPTIVFNGKYSKEESDAAQVNFIKALCAHISDEKPEECKSGSATVAISSLLLVLSFNKLLF